MRKTTVVFSDEQWNQLSAIARREYRFPKQQIELWVCQALSRAQEELPAKPQPPMKASAPSKPAHQRAQEGSGAS